MWNYKDSIEKCFLQIVTENGLIVGGLIWVTLLILTGWEKKSCLKMVRFGFHGQEGFIGVEATYFWCGHPQFRRFSSYGLRGESWFCCLYRQELAHSAVPCLFCFRFMSDFHFYFRFLKNNLYPFYFYISKNKIKILFYFNFFYFNFFYIILMCWSQN